MPNELQPKLVEFWFFRGDPSCVCKNHLLKWLVVFARCTLNSARPHCPGRPVGQGQMVPGSWIQQPVKFEVPTACRFGLRRPWKATGLTSDVVNGLIPQTCETSARQNLPTSQLFTSQVMEIAVRAPSLMPLASEMAGNPIAECNPDSVLIAHFARLPKLSPYPQLLGLTEEQLSGGQFVGVDLVKHTSCVRIG